MEIVFMYNVAFRPRRDWISRSTACTHIYSVRFRRHICLLNYCILALWSVGIRDLCVGGKNQVQEYECRLLHAIALARRRSPFLSRNGSTARFIFSDISGLSRAPAWFLVLNKSERRSPPIGFASEKEEKLHAKFRSSHFSRASAAARARACHPRRGGRPKGA